jgi:CheY-like chemotaxis protein
MVPLQSSEQSSTRLERGSSVTTGRSPPIDPKELHILVVEDNLVNQKVLMKQLQKVGCTVSVADNGKEALAYLEHTGFRKKEGRKLSVILMDLEMPVMDGLTCVRLIR